MVRLSPALSSVWTQFFSTLPICYIALENFKIQGLSLMGFFQIADKVDRMKNMMNKHGQKADNFVHGIREHRKYLFLSFIQTSSSSSSCPQNIKACLHENWSISPGPRHLKFYRNIGLICSLCIHLLCLGGGIWLKSKK